MSTSIYCFSGTGNSLSIARQLGIQINDKVNIIDLACYTHQKQIEITTDAIGFVFPVYFQTIPDIVKNFIRKIRFKTKPYIFAVATCNAGPGHCLFTLNKHLNKIGLSLSSGFIIDMPGNSLIVRDYTNPIEVQKQRLLKSNEKVSEISSYINKRCILRLEGNNKFKYHLKGFITGTFAKYVYKTPSKFTVTDKCIHCSICVSICPVKNIKLSDKNPNWGKKCTQCLACFHWCPKQAIEIGISTVNKKRYTNPDISIEDIIKNRTLNTSAN